MKLKYCHVTFSPSVCPIMNQSENMSDSKTTWDLRFTVSHDHIMGSCLEFTKVTWFLKLTTAPVQIFHWIADSSQVNFCFQARLNLFRIIQLVDQCKSCILISYAIVLKQQNWLNPAQHFRSFFSQIRISSTCICQLYYCLFCLTSWVILKQLNPLPSRARGQQPIW